MKRVFLRNFLVSLAVVGFFSANLYAGWFDSDNFIQVVESQKPGANAPAVKYAVTIRVAGYTDARNGMTPKQIGISTQRISGITGKELALDRDVTEVVANSIKKRFDDAGFQLVDSAALYELSGVVRELTYNVKNQDEVAISIETTLKEVATGKVVWSGVVAEKPSGRFAGVSGNSKSDIANYLHRELSIVTQKTSDAISASLMASRPDLFNLTPGTKAIVGVTVFQAAGTSPAAAGVALAKPVSAAAVNGTLALNTKPTRAKVYLDGVYYGMSPLRAEIEVGIHEVSVKHDGYKTAAEKVSVRKGDTTELELVLER